ncbi:hypothetical protein [Streptomyces sp. DW26H14]|uniref:hypothetical protein n=1 Tax=Streptomyces sp. DW26H14 TaxID=3435395 RepID=UPI00403DE400
MTLSLAELAALPTAPTVSAVLAEATRYVADGPLTALRRAVHGSTPEHLAAEGQAVFVVAGLITRNVDKVGPLDAAWGPTNTAIAVDYSRQVVDAWAKTHSVDHLAHLFKAAADRARTAEHPHA